MIAALRTFFLSRSLREKVLLVLLAVGLDGYWLSRFSDRCFTFTGQVRSVQADLADQARWLSNRDAILKRAQEAASRLDPSRTLNGIQLYAAVSDMASDAGLSNVRSGDTTDDRSGQFAVHSVRFDITRADWNSLWTFYQALQQRSPYIGIEQCAITSDPPNPSLLNMSVLVSSVEIAQ